MHRKKFFIIMPIIVLTLILAVCSDGNEPGKNHDIVKSATVTFQNFTSYDVDIYKNLNPANFDPLSFICTLYSGQVKKVEQDPSYDQEIGDTFYPRYKVILADSVDTGTTDIYVDAQRGLSVLSNIPLVIKSEGNYTKEIPHPGTDLKFVNGYIAVKNMKMSPVQIHRGDTVLKKLDDKSVYLSGDPLGYYEITLSSFDDTLNISQLRAFDGSYMNFPEFVMERGKLYTFTIPGAGIIGPPVITNIDILNK